MQVLGFLVRAEALGILGRVEEARIAARAAINASRSTGQRDALAGRLKDLLEAE
jgi:predicted RNA polymerase sigma factor